MSADFFGRQCNLTVSGQLEAEALALGLGSVYTFGPTFRAENSNTPRHAAEFWMIEPEMAFADLQDLMPVKQMPIPRAAIDIASEVLLFTSSTLCVGITHFDGKPVGSGAQAGHPGPVARRLRQDLLAYMLEKGAPF